MGTYQDDMKDEKKPSGIIPEGHRLVRVLEMMPDVSKSGNNMFVTVIEDVKTKTNMTVWLVSEPKKRWLLKSLLNAAEVPAGQDGVYDWSITDVLGKAVIAVIEHYQEPWVNREGVEVSLNKAKVTEFLKPVKDSTGESIAWEE
jgi:hypothetical protein